ncbi:MAG: terminase small subunit [Thiomicrospira sp.]
MALKQRQQKFVEQYLIDLNATQAAIRAGYSAHYANTNAFKLLQNTAIASAVTDAMKLRSERTEITQDRVLTELAKIGFSDIRQAVKWGPSLGEIVDGDSIMQTNGVLLVDSDQLDDSTAASIAEISQTAQGIKIKLHDKRAALVDIGRHLGMFNDKLSLTADSTLNIILKKPD